MQENERLFPQEDEEGVAELGDLGKHEQRCPEARDSVVGDETESVFAILINDDEQKHNIWRKKQRGR